MFGEVKMDLAAYDALIEAKNRYERERDEWRNTYFSMFDSLLEVIADEKRDDEDIPYYLRTNSLIKRMNLDRASIVENVAQRCADMKGENND